MTHSAHSNHLTCHSARVGCKSLTAIRSTPHPLSPIQSANQLTINKTHTQHLTDTQPIPITPIVTEPSLVRLTVTQPNLNSLPVTQPNQISLTVTHYSPVCSPLTKPVPISSTAPQPLSSTTLSVTQPDPLSSPILGQITLA